MAKTNEYGENRGTEEVPFPNASLSNNDMSYSKNNVIEFESLKKKTVDNTLADSGNESPLVKERKGLSENVSNMLELDPAEKERKGRGGKKQFEQKNASVLGMKNQPAA